MKSKRIIRKLVKEEIENQVPQKRRGMLTEKINTPNNFFVEYHIGKFLKRTLTMVLNQVKRNIERSADLRVSKEPLAKLGASIFTIHGYTRSDIESKVSLRAIYYNSEVEYKAIIDTPRDVTPGSITETWVVDGDEDPQRTLNSIARYIIGTGYGYDNKLK